MVTMMDEKMIEEKMDFFTGTDVQLHIVKKDKEWFNCIILSKKNGVYIVNERKFGVQHLFLKEIYNISEKKEEKNDVDSITTETAGY